LVSTNHTNLLLCCKNVHAKWWYYACTFLQVTYSLVLFIVVVIKDYKGISEFFFLESQQNDTVHICHFFFKTCRSLLACF
jgi:hypothetical protein